MKLRWYLFVVSIAIIFLAMLLLSMKSQTCRRLVSYYENYRKEKI